MEGGYEFESIKSRRSPRPAGLIPRSRLLEFPSSRPEAVQARRMAQLPSWLTSFHPRRGLSNGHLQTIVGNFLPRPPFLLPSTPETVSVDHADGSRVLCHCHWQPEPYRSSRLTAVLVHGLEGSSESRYMLGITARAWAAGMNVVRMNMRNCGGSETLTPGLYHSGLSADLAAVVEHFSGKYALTRVALIGYSMGGNLVLKLAGEWRARSPLVAVATVCPAIDLAAGSDALHQPLNRLYERHFLRNLMRRYRRKVALFPSIYQPAHALTVRSIREFDDKIVAPYCGFVDADDYYHRAACATILDRIAVPTLVLCAQDDPFIRITPKSRARLLANPHIVFVETRHGGHCAFLGRASGNDIHWAEAAVIRYLVEVSTGAFPACVPIA
jgi:uncharacterized protein